MPGRLVLGPTSTSTPGSTGLYGGSAVGVRRAARLVPIGRYQDIEDPANGALLGVAPRKVERVRLGFLLEPPWDDTTLAKAYTQTSTQNGQTRLEGAVIPRARVQTMGAQLAFIADDPNHKSVLFKIAVPRLSLQEAIELSLDGPGWMPVVFDPLSAIDTGDAGYPYVPTKPPWQVCRWADMSL